MKLLTLEEPRALEQAISAMQHGGIVAFPTDTVYGIGASLAFPDALERIFELKGRDRDRPLPLLLASPAELAKVTGDVDPDLLRLAGAFWPGPLTIALPALDGLPSQVVADDGTVGVRVPDHSVALILAQRCGGAIAVTSANLSGQTPALRPEQIDPTLADNLDLVLDGGIARGGLASTVIVLGDATISVIREGAISRTEIEAAWSDIRSGQSGEIERENPAAATPR
ncbi:MAG: threonylcarbamoyl-AMP synthase [Chloroflexia bacterium]|nr:threonylcarbamoyl-AMP synthase [Chloroflexia bacterium]